MSSNQAFPRSGHDLETHNDDLLSGLMGKVDVLKSVSAISSVLGRYDRSSKRGQRRHSAVDVAASCPVPAAEKRTGADGSLPSVLETRCAPEMPSSQAWWVHNNCYTSALADPNPQTDDFGSTSNVLSGTWKRMTRMAKRQSTGWCYFMGFMLLVLWIFIIVWWLRR